MPIGSLKKICRRTSGPNWALWRSVLIPIARHHPVEPSARATSSITCRVVRMSAPSPPSASGSATRKRRAFAISMTRSAGSWRAVSISAARFRMRGASDRAISSGVVTAGTGSVIMALGGPPARWSRYAAPAAGETSRSLCPEVDVQDHLSLVLDGPQGGAIGLVAEARLLEGELGSAAEKAGFHGDLGRELHLVGDAADREPAGDEKPAVELLRDRGGREGDRGEAGGGELAVGLHRGLDVGAILGRRLAALQPEFPPGGRVVSLERLDLDLHLDRRRVGLLRVVGDRAREDPRLHHVVVGQPGRHAVLEDLDHQGTLAGVDGEGSGPAGLDPEGRNGEEQRDAERDPHTYSRSRFRMAR